MLRVLLVDDNLIMLEYLETLLDWSALGMEIVGRCTNGRQALEVLELVNPHIVIADISMPLVDGIQFSQEAMAKHPVLRIILVTSYAKFEYAKRAIELGVSNYILKHELTAQTLYAQMSELKKNIVFDMEVNQLRDKNLFRALLIGKQPGEGAATPYSNQDVILLGLYAKRSFVSFSERLDLAACPLQLKGVPIIEEGELLPFDENNERILFLLILCKPLVSKLKADACIREAAHTILSKLSQESQAFIMAAPSIKGLKALQQSYRLLCSAYENRMFLNEYPVYMVPNAETECHCLELPQEVLSFIQLLDARNFSQAAEQSAAAFENIIQTKNTKALAQLLPRLRLIIEAEEQFYYVDDLGCFVQQMLRELAMHQSEGYSKLVNKAIECLKRDPRNATLETVSEACGFSADYLGRVFRRETGQKFTQFATEYKINLARQMLETGDYRIYEVSEELGYKTSQYFSLVFHKITGVNPSDCIKGM